MKLRVTRRPARRAPRLGSQGFALPMVMLGLLVVTLLATATLATGTMEGVTGAAHQDATRSLYEAEAALDWYVADRAAGKHDMEVGTFERILPSGARARFHSAQLSRPDSTTGRPKVWQITAEPVTGFGRSVSALVNTQYVIQAPQPIVVNAAFTHGYDTEVFPVSTTSGTRMFGTPSTTVPCSDNTRRDIMLRASGAKYTNKGSSSAFPGETWSMSSLGHAALRTQILQGAPLSALTSVADYRWGPMFGEPKWIAKTPIRATNGKVGVHPHNWGCPTGMGAGCEGVPGAADFWPIIVIDANLGHINFDSGVHGQGVLIIVNGHAHIHPPFRWKGLVIVEGALEIHGGKELTSNHVTHIEGAAVSFGTPVGKGVQLISKHENQSIIRFNRCAIDAANVSIAKFSNLKPGDHLSYRPYSRTEGVR
jgi:hypothetical protein